MRIARHGLTLVMLSLVFCLITGIVSPAQTLTTLALFNFSNGSSPTASLVQGTDGNFYGTTQYGGLNTVTCEPMGCGTVFRVTPSGLLTNLYSFCPQPYCYDGNKPHAALVQGADGNLYGTTEFGGTGGEGTIFRITPGGTFTTVHSFCSQPACIDGLQPRAPLVQATDGSFYGTARGGGASGNGVVFKITSDGTLTTLYSFCSHSCSDGASPTAGLVQGADGNFYGTTQEGGANGQAGTVFKITPGGTLTTLYSFCSQPNCIDGFLPLADLVQGTDGNFYGTTTEGGTMGSGTAFRITPAGTLTTLHSFNESTDGIPYTAGLMQATDGNFYGTTEVGGPASGTVFRITPAGIFTTVYSFCTQLPCTDGSVPLGGVIQGTNGLLYGTTSLGGTPGQDCPGGCGTVFSLAVGTQLSPVQFVPVTPCRLADTRQTQTPIQAGTSQFFNVPQLGSCNIPATAAAYSLNVTVVPHQRLGYLTIWPAGRPQPAVSTMNSPDGRTKANAAIVPAGANAALSVYATDTTDVILDSNGYFTTPSSQTLQFYTLPPCRIVDTRNNMHGGTLHAGVERDYTIPTNCGVPRSAQAYSFNITVIPPSGGLDYLTVWPKGETQPVVSTLNDDTGTIVANAAIVPAGPDNATAFYAHSNRTDLLIDVNGYFAPPGTGGLSLYPVAPCRVLDTRGVGNGQPFQGVYNSPNGVDVLTSPCAPPSTSKAFVFNATVVPPGSLPYLTLWPHGESQPNVSTLNATDGAVTSNMAIVPTNDGSIDAYAAGLTQLILDISGYFAP